MPCAHGSHALQISLRQAAAAQSAPLASLLRDEVQASPASVHFPYVAGQGASWQQSLRPEAGALWVGGSCRSGMAQPLSGLAAALERGDATLLLLCVEDCAAGAGACMAQALKTVQQHAASKGLKAAYAYLPESTAQVSALLQGTFMHTSRRGVTVGPWLSLPQLARPLWVLLPPSCRAAHWVQPLHVS